MKNLHLIIQIALGIILGHGYVAGLLMKDNYYKGQQIDFGYCWPLVVYLVVLLAIWLVRLVITTEDGNKNGSSAATTKKAG